MWDQHYNLYLDPSWFRLPICCSNDPCQLPAAAEMVAVLQSPVRRWRKDQARPGLDVCNPDLGLVSVNQARGDDRMIR